MNVSFNMKGDEGMKVSDTAVRQTTVTCCPTGSTLGPEVQIEVQELHHVSELVVVRILSELNMEAKRSEHRQSKRLHKRAYKKGFLCVWRLRGEIGHVSAKKKKNQINKSHR